MEFLRHKSVVFVIDGVIFLICVLGIYHVAQKGGVPVVFDEWDGKVRCARLIAPSYEQYIQPGEFVKSIDGIRVQNVEDIEFILDARQVGEFLDFEIDGTEGTQIVAIPLTHYYSVLYIVIASIVGLLFFLIGVFVFYHRPDDKAAVLFHWGSMSAATMILVTSGRYTIEPEGLGIGLRMMFLLAQSLLPVLFFHFTFVFPREKWFSSRKYILSLYSVGFVLGVVPSILFLQAASTISIDYFHEFLYAFFTARWFFVVLGVMALLSLVHSYRSAAEEPERKKLRWILWGLLAGVTPYLLLWVIPQIIIKEGLIPEEGMLVLSSLVPITFGISIVRYRLMDIDLILNRSVVYGLVMGLLLALYSAIVGALAIAVSTFTASTSFLISAAAAISVALLFEPLRVRVQRFVDQKFFRVHYNFREAQRTFVEEIKNSLDLHQLSELIVKRVDELLSVERIGFFTVKKPSERLQLWAHKNYDILETRGVRFETEKLKTRLNLPVAVSDKIEPGTPFDPADAEIFRRWGMALVFPMVSEHGEILGFLVLGEKKSGTRFTVEDVDLLNSVSAQAGLAIERVMLQQKLLLEHAEAQRLEELNRLKSYFVSSVSHDLKTPLTSIKMFAELLRSKKRTPSKAAREYLEIIQGESDRLTRLINNVLDFAKVERGVKEYHFSPVKLNETVRSVLRSMQYQLKMGKCLVRIKLSKRDCTLRADTDAVAEALINILSNAMKYSLKKKQIIVSTFQRDGYAGVRIDDNGLGISREDLNNIFEPFFRAHGGKTQQIGGTGLGLALVKNIMEAHSGRVEVHSTLGKGSSFTLLFPIQPSDRITGGAR